MQKGAGYSYSTSLLIKDTLVLSRGVGQEESATNCEIVTPETPRSFLPVDKLQRCSAGFAEGLVTETDLVVHDAGQTVLSTAASVDKRSWYDSGWRGPVTVAAFCLKTETITHNRLPLCAVRPWLQSFFSRLPVDDQMTHFVGKGLL